MHVATRGSHIHVACRSVCDGIKNFDRWKSSLIARSLCSEALDRLIILRKRCNYDVHWPRPSWIINQQKFRRRKAPPFSFEPPFKEFWLWACNGIIAVWNIYPARLFARSGSVALRKGPRRFCPHCSDRYRTLMLTCQNSPLWQRCERCNNVLSSFWLPLHR